MYFYQSCMPDKSLIHDMHLMKNAKHRCFPCITDTSNRLLQQNKCRKTFEESVTVISYLILPFFFLKNTLLRKKIPTFGTARHRSNHLISVCQLCQHLGTLNKIFQSGIYFESRARGSHRFQNPKILDEKIQKYI